MDRGPKFITKLKSERIKIHEIGFKYIQPRKLNQNAIVERFNGSYREGALDEYIFKSLEQVRRQTRIWIDDYHYHRPFYVLENLL